MKKPELISFALCPFVQRSVITLLDKGVDFDITYIDLASPPQWFLDISPLGKVPVLRHGDAVLFESAVINEYLDELTPPTYHPKNPLQKALNRAWIEFGSNLLMTEYMLMVAADEQAFSAKCEELAKLLPHFERVKSDAAFFNDDQFSLVDAALAPFFMRLDILERMKPIGYLDKTPRLKSWSEALLARESVRKSVKPEFEQLLTTYLKDHNSYIGGLA